ncbi:hypothetical protein RQP46_007747 [Phenoliferia psychrophenolica]
MGGSTTPAGTPAGPALSFGKREAGGDADGGGKKPAFGGFGSTTPAGAPPASTSLFGQAATAGGTLGTKPPASLFGAPQAAPATSAPSLFGAPPAPAATSAPSLFGAPPAAAPPAPSSLFGAPPGKTLSAFLRCDSATCTHPSDFELWRTEVCCFGAPPAAASAPSLFGAKPAPAAAPATSAPLSFGAPAPAATAAAAPPATLSFGAPKPAAPTTSAASLFPAPAAATSGALTLGGAKPAAAPLGGLSFGAAPTASTSTPVAAASNISAPVPSMLKGKTLEEIVNKWSTELEDRKGDFELIAGEVRQWDTTLRQNGEKISALYTSVLPLPELQRNISGQLDYVESHQKELSERLDAYEAQIDGLVEQTSTSSGWRGNSGNAEKEREKAYTLASSLSTSLDTTASSLTTLIQTLNALSPSLRPTTSASTSEAAEDPLTQIAAILNAHLGSLRWIEGTTDGLQKSVADLEQRVAQQTFKNGHASVRESRSAAGTPVRGQGMGASAFGRSRG